MTLVQLIQYLDQHTSFAFLHGDAEQTFQAARDGTHPNELAAEMIVAIAKANQCDDVNGELAREVVVNALGPLRLKYMADDAPVDGFRMLESSVVAVDDAFNAEALAAKRGD